MKELNVALIGLGFGGCFLPIYLDHPNVAEVTVYDANPEVLARFTELYPAAKVAESFDAILADESIDAVHLVTPIPLHADQSVAVLEA